MPNYRFNKKNDCNFNFKSIIEGTTAVSYKNLRDASNFNLEKRHVQGGYWLITPVYKNKFTSWALQIFSRNSERSLVVAITVVLLAGKSTSGWLCGTIVFIFFRHFSRSAYFKALNQAIFHISPDLATFRIPCRVFSLVLEADGIDMRRKKII